MPKPDTKLARRAQLISWLGEYGIPAAEVDKCIRCGAISRRKTRENARGFYEVAEVEQKILAPLVGLNQSRR